MQIATLARTSLMGRRPVAGRAPMGAAGSSLHSADLAFVVLISALGLIACLLLGSAVSGPEMLDVIAGGWG